MILDRPVLRRVRIVSSGAAATASDLLARELPTITLEHVVAPRADDPVIDAAEWVAARDFEPFDEAVVCSRSDAIAVRGAVVEDVALEVLTRYQRFVSRRNQASRSAMFDGVLRAHRAMHDFTKPLVAADYDHALDTWQWMLRLCPDASLVAQLAAVLHDVERLDTEAERRVEHRASDYQAFKDAHARNGGAKAEAMLLSIGVSEKIAARVRAIVAAHERRGRDQDVDLLNDADGLSFFSLNSAGYADYFGPEQTKEKIRYTLGRLGKEARARLSQIRLREDVRRLVDSVRVSS